MEIGIIAAIILMAFAFALAKSPAGPVIVELIKLVGTAVMLCAVVLVAFFRPGRTPATS